MSNPESTATTHAHHGPSARTLTLVLGALLVLTAITVTAASVDFGSPMVNVVIALTIASIKGSLVALFFMHLRYDKPINAIIFVGGLIVLGLFLGFTFVDTDARDHVIPSNLKAPAAAPAPAKPVAPAKPH